MLPNLIFVLVYYDKTERPEPFVAAYYEMDRAAREIAAARHFTGKMGEITIQPIAAPVLFAVLDDNGEQIGTIHGVPLS